MRVTDAVIGVMAVSAGLIISYHFDTAGSATMAVVPIVLFFAVLTIKNVADRASRPVTASS